MKRTVAARAIGRGLAKVEPTSPNTMIAFAAKAGSTASDGDSKNSPFAAALVERLPTPGLDLRKAFGFVRDDVLKNTSYKQEPYVYGSLGGDDVALVAAKPTATGPQASPDDAIRRNYELALQLGTRDGWDVFLAQYPGGFYAGLAKGQLNKISAKEARAAAVEKARQAEEDKARLAADRAKKSDQDKAAAAAKAAEDARLAAEKAKQVLWRLRGFRRPCGRWQSCKLLVSFGGDFLLCCRLIGESLSNSGFNLFAALLGGCGCNWPVAKGCCVARACAG